ncbi:hypothetical protein IMZ48_09930, partial [Candidatus Bathyarchaeota archaeon]|nr:hypothetical protein [Candidatus Bathyarchaeota archaeon]
MPARRKIKLWQPEVALLPDIHHYLLLLAGEALKLKSRRRLVLLAVKCESAVVARTIAQGDGPCRIVVPIAHLAIGHAHYLHRDI